MNPSASSFSTICGSTNCAGAAVFASGLLEAASRGRTLSGCWVGLGDETIEVTQVGFFQFLGIAQFQMLPQHRYRTALIGLVEVNPLDDRLDEIFSDQRLGSDIAAPRDDRSDRQLKSFQDWDVSVIEQIESGPSGMKGIRWIERRGVDVAAPERQQSRRRVADQQVAHVFSGDEAGGFDDGI